MGLFSVFGYAAYAYENLEATLTALASKAVTTIGRFTEISATGQLYNSAAVFHQGAVAGVYRKLHPAIRKSICQAGDKHPYSVRAVGSQPLGRKLEGVEIQLHEQLGVSSRQGVTMASTDSCVTIHMVASLDGFIARKDGRVDWLETSDEFKGGDTLDAEFVQDFLKTIDCYVMGSRTYETALDFEAKGFEWSYGDKPTFVLTRRELPKTRDTVEFYSGDLSRLVNERLKPTFRSIWFVGGGAVSGECLRLGLADEVRYSIMPILIGEGIPFFDRLDKDVALHLVEVKAYTSGMVALRHEVRK